MDVGRNGGIGGKDKRQSGIVYLVSALKGGHMNQETKAQILVAAAAFCSNNDALSKWHLDNKDNWDNIADAILNVAKAVEKKAGSWLEQQP